MNDEKAYFSSSSISGKPRSQFDSQSGLQPTVSLLSGQASVSSVKDIWWVLSGFREKLPTSGSGPIREMLVNRLYSLDADDLDFYLPQLCQMIIDQGPVASLSLQRVLTDLCRRNFRTGVLAGFYFASAVAGEAEEREEMQHLNNHCRRDIQIATISGNKNKELEEMLNIFKHMQNPSRGSEDGQWNEGSGQFPLSHDADHIGHGRSAGEISDKANGNEEIEEETEEAEDAHSYLRGVGSFVNRLAYVDDEKKSVSSLSLEEMTRIEEMIRSLIPHHTDPMVSLDDYYKRHSALFHSVNDLSPRPELPTNNSSVIHEQVSQQGHVSVDSASIAPTTTSTLSTLVVTSPTARKNGLEEWVIMDNGNVALSTSGPAQEAKSPFSFDPSRGSRSSIDCVGIKMTDKAFQERKKKLSTLATAVQAKVLSETHILTQTGDTNMFRMPWHFVLEVYNSAKTASPLDPGFYSDLSEFLQNSISSYSPNNTITGERDQISESKEPVGVTPPDVEKYQMDSVARELCRSISETQPDAKHLKDELYSWQMHQKYYTCQMAFMQTLTDISCLIKAMKLITKGKNDPNLTLTQKVPYMLNIEVVDGYFELSSLQGIKKPPLEQRDPPLSRNVAHQVDTGMEVVRNRERALKSMGEKENTEGKNDTSPRPVLDEIFGPDWETRKKLLREASPVGHLQGWDVISIVVKGGDDLRQEQLAMQLIKLFSDIFRAENLPLWVNPYMVMATSSDAGIIETVHDAVSIHGLKSSTGFTSLNDFFIRAYGAPSSTTYKRAQTNFVESVAGYSLVTYLLQIKDRHNGNILIDREGHITHIDYGYMLSSFPGKFEFEKSPFKLSLDMVEVMGGIESDTFQYFKLLIQSGFIALRKNYLKILCLTELMLEAGGGMDCFKLGPETITKLKERFELNLSEEEALRFGEELVTESVDNWRTGAYDNFQKYSNGIL